MRTKSHQLKRPRRKQEMNSKRFLLLTIKLRLKLQKRLLLLKRHLQRLKLLHKQKLLPMLLDKK